MFWQSWLTGSSHRFDSWWLYQVTFNSPKGLSFGDYIQLRLTNSQYTNFYTKDITHYDPLCNFPMNYKAALCKNCRQKYRKTHINGYYITPDNLIAILKYYNGNFTKTRYLFDVTGNAIVKYLKRCDLPYHRKDYQQTE